MQKLNDFLLRERLCADSFDFSEEVERFRAEMRRGLDGEKSSLYMIPTFLSAGRGAARDGRVVVLDAGGTNLRAGTVTFSGGKATDVTFEKSRMPGTDGTLSAEVFFDRIAEKAAPYLDAGDRLGFCFSYATNCREDRDGTIIEFCKEVSVTGAEGLPVCASLDAALRRRGMQKQLRCVQLNDTVAALLGGMAVTDPAEYDGYIGFILGTGMNSCYSEKTAEIKKYKGSAYRDETMIVNMEAGCYSGFSGGSVDRAVDADSAVPGDHLSEKLMSGAYLGKILAAALDRAADEGLLSKRAALPEIPMPDVNAFLAGGTSCLSDSFPEPDHAAIRAIIESLYGRTARLMAVILTAIALQTGTGTKKPICVVLEGSTYQKSPRLQEKLEEELRRVRERFGCTFEIRFAENSTLTGAAYAAMTNG